MSSVVLIHVVLSVVVAYVVLHFVLPYAMLNSVLAHVMLSALAVLACVTECCTAPERWCCGKTCLTA